MLDSLLPVWSCSGRTFTVNVNPAVIHTEDSYTQGTVNNIIQFVDNRIWCFLQNVYYTSTQELYVGLLSPTVDDDDNKCLVDVNSRPRLVECSYAAAKRMKLHWLFTQVTTHEKDTRTCLYSASVKVNLLDVMGKPSVEVAFNQASGLI